MPRSISAKINSSIDIPQPRLDLSDFLPPAFSTRVIDQRSIPQIAKDPKEVAAIEAAIHGVPTRHILLHRDARNLDDLPPGSVHLVVTSPPYWTLKEYREHEHQLGAVADYNEFLNQLARVWHHCFRVLVPGGRLICVVGDVCMSRRQNNGRHTVVPLHAAIQERCRTIGFDNVAPIIWHKIANAKYEIENGGAGFLGKPYEPNSVIKNDIEFILMQRKPGGYRKPSVAERLLSVISHENYHRWFRQIWDDIPGASTREHPAPFPEVLAERLVRMFSFVGDVVLDPFMGTGTSNVAAARWGRNSIGIEVDPTYHSLAKSRLTDLAGDLFSSISIESD